MSSWHRSGRLGRTWVLFLLLPVVGGCIFQDWSERRYREEPIAENPFPQVRRVVVAEFRDWSGRGINGRELAGIFASELSALGFYEVVPVAQAMAASAERNLDSADPRGAVILARALEADAVVVGGVSSYEPYVPKRLGLNAVVLATGPELSAEGAKLIMELERAGKAMRAFPTAGAEGILAFKGRLFDASSNDVVEEAKFYAACRRGREGPLGWKAYLEITDEFLRFACNRLIRGMVSEGIRTKGAGAQIGTE